MKSSIGEMSWKVSSQSLVEEPLETIALNRDQIGDVEYFRDLGEAASLAPISADERGTFSAGHQAIPPSGVEAADNSRKT